MSKNSKQLAKELQGRLSRLAVKGKALSLRDLGIWLTEIETLYIKLYSATGGAVRLQDFLD